MSQNTSSSRGVTGSPVWPSPTTSLPPPIGQMVTVGGDLHCSPQIPLTQHQSPQFTQQSAPRMVLAKPLNQGSKSISAQFVQLASQLPKLTPQMILASMKTLQQQQQQQQHRVVAHTSSVAQVVGALPPRSLMPKVVFRPAANLTSRPLPKVVTRTMQPTLETSGSHRVVAPLVIPPPAVSQAPTSPLSYTLPSRITITNKPRKPCNCKNSQCLKLYCDCFANGEFCRESCNCLNCKNSVECVEDRAKAIKVCLDRNPNAFKPKVGQNRTGDERRHIKGCNCKRSWCLKNYCECYEAKIPCSANCRCVGCKNLPEQSDKALMHLADAADLRTQQAAADSQFFDQLELGSVKPLSLDGQRLPFSFVNEEVTKATTLCLLEEASHAAASGKSYVDAERDVLMEFSRCLSQIIRSSQSANEDESRTMQAY